MTTPKPPRTRFDVVLNEQLARDFDELARREHVSRADIFKRAMAAYKLLKEESARGARIIVQEEGQPDRQLIAL
jgi:metal-responsive CopG/Arc/MetJ family transcriptional regulator